MHTLKDEIELAEDTRCYEVEEFDGTTIVIVPLGARSVTAVAQRLGLIESHIHIHGYLTGQVDGRNVTITKNAEPHLNSETVTACRQLT